MRRAIIYIFCLCATLCITHGRKLPSFVKTCSRNVKEPMACLLDSIDHLKPYLIKGIPEMGVPAMDPLRIVYLHLSEGGSLTYSANLTNMVFTGAKDFTIQNADVNLKDKIFRLVLHIPRFEVHGHYEINGKILMIQLLADGDFNGELVDVLLDGTWNARVEMRKGKEHFVFDKNDVAVGVKSFRSEFKDLFKGNQMLTDNTNRIINENADALFEEINPIVTDGIGQMVTTVLNKVHEIFSNDQLYPDVPV